MNFLYHAVPRQMMGTKLAPLNTFKSSHPKLYELYMSKYRGRERVMRNYVLPLKCFWNDVVFLSPINPIDLSNAFESAGAGLISRKFFRIDPRQLDPSNTTVWLYRTLAKNAEDFVPFRIEDLAKYSKISPPSIEYYRQQHIAKKPILMFAYVPHILVKGTVDVSNSEIVTV